MFGHRGFIGRRGVNVNFNRLPGFSPGRQKLFVYSFNGHIIRSPARMMRLMQRFQAFARDVGVNLRGRNIGVAEQQLHHA